MTEELAQNAQTILGTNLPPIVMEAGIIYLFIKESGLRRYLAAFQGFIIVLVGLYLYKTLQAGGNITTAVNGIGQMTSPGKLNDVITSLKNAVDSFGRSVTSVSPLLAPATFYGSFWYKGKAAIKHICRILFITGSAGILVLAYIWTNRIPLPFTISFMN